VLLDEASDFTPVARSTPQLPNRSQVDLREAYGGLRVQLVATPFGMPRRWRRPPAVWLRPGQWVRWHINYRFSWPAARGGAWSYRLDMLNLIYGSAEPGQFTGTPTRFVDDAPTSGSSRLRPGLRHATQVGVRPICHTTARPPA
jgi:hypothetical protein